MAEDTVKLPVTLNDRAVLNDEILDELVKDAEGWLRADKASSGPRTSWTPTAGAEGVSPRSNSGPPAGVHELARARATQEGRTVRAVM